MNLTMADSIYFSVCYGFIDRKSLAIYPRLPRECMPNFGTHHAYLKTGYQATP